MSYISYNLIYSIDFVSYIKVMVIKICFYRLAFYFPMILSTGLLLSEKDEGIMNRIMVAGILSVICEIVFISNG